MTNLNVPPAISADLASRFVDVAIEVVADLPDAEVGRLIAAAERVCYVTNTLRQAPSITVRHVRPDG